MELSNLSLYFSVFVKRGETALIIAAQEGHVEVVSSLLAAGANIEAANYVRNCFVLDFETSIRLQYSSCRLQINTLQFHGTALMMAAREGHAAVVEVLLDGGANIEAAVNVSQHC